MMAIEIFPRIVVDPAVRTGRPVIKGTRIPVEEVLDLLASGLPPAQILADCYPSLTAEDISACLGYAAHVVRDEEVHVAAPRP